MKSVFFISQPLKGIVLETLKDIIRSSKFQYVALITNLNPTSYNEDEDYFDILRDNILMWMQNAVRYFSNIFYSLKTLSNLLYVLKNFACDIFYEKFPFACLPHSASPSQANNSSYQCFLNPLCSWSPNTSPSNFNQIINSETYQRLVNQEYNELHTLANSSSTNTKDHFQQYYQNFSQDDLNEIKV